MKGEDIRNLGSEKTYKMRNLESTSCLMPLLIAAPLPINELGETIQIEEVIYLEQINGSFWIP